MFKAEALMLMPRPQFHDCRWLERLSRNTSHIKHIARQTREVRLSFATHNLQSIEIVD